MLGKMAEQKPVLTLFTKSDLADPVVTEEWLEAWEGPRPMALIMSERKSVTKVTARCRELAPNRGGPGRTLKILVVGIPNVGKSTMINTLTGKRIAKVGDRPAGITATVTSALFVFPDTHLGPAASLARGEYVKKWMPSNSCHSLASSSVASEEVLHVAWRVVDNNERSSRENGTGTIFKPDCITATECTLSGRLAGVPVDMFEPEV